MADWMRRGACCVVLAGLAGACAGPTPLATASIVVKESLGASSEQVGSAIRARYPSFTAHVCVTCPECAEDAQLELTFRGTPGSTAPVGPYTALPVCGPNQFELWAEVPRDDPGDSTVEVSDGNSAIRATFADAVFAPRVASYPGPGPFAMCVGAVATLDWTPAGDLPETPITGTGTSVSYYSILPGCLSECSGGGFVAALTADRSGIQFTVPPYGGSMTSGGELYLTLPAAEAEPALRCDGGVDCSVHPFAMAAMPAPKPTQCSP